MKKTLLWAVPVALLSSAAWGNKHSGKDCHGGFSVGIFGGISNPSGKIDRTLTAAGPTVSKDHVKAGDHGGFGGAMIGFGGNLGGLYAGLEGYGQFQSVKGDSYIGLNGLSPKLTLKWEMKESFGGGVNLGAPMDKFLPFIHLGARSTKFELSQTLDLATPAMKKTSKRATSFAGGLGFAYAASRSMCIELRHVYSMGKKINLQQVNGANTYDIKWDPSCHETRMGIKFKF